MDLMESNWFTEVSELWPDQRFSFRYKKILYHAKSDFQDILVLESVSHGNVLVLDGIVQCSESDEFSYQEMISFLPLNSHPNPEKVLIVGGGDGGVAREVTKHPKVQSCVQVEIDPQVIETSKKYLPSMAEGFYSPKLILCIEDGLEYLKRHVNEFDVIITDSSDPIGPAECLFSDTYFKLLLAALRPNGVVCSQAGNAFNCTKQVSDLVQIAKKSFDKVNYAYSSVPTYPSGQIGYLLATNCKLANLINPATVFTEEDCDKLKLKYYDSSVHVASFQLPRFIKKALNL